jgi:integrase
MEVKLVQLSFAFAAASEPAPGSESDGGESAEPSPLAPSGPGPAGTASLISSAKPEEQAPSVAAPRNLAEVVARLQADLGLGSNRQRDLISAVRRMAELVGKPLDALAADLNALRPRINAVRPALHQISPKTWTNLKTNFRAAVLSAGGHQRSQAPRSPDWQVLHERLPDKRMANGLSRFITWCSGQGIAAEQVDDAAMTRFRAALGTDTLVPDPNDCHRRSARLWNEAVARVPGWPACPVVVPDYHQPRTTLHEQDLPASFGADLRRHLEWAAGTDPLAEPAPPKALAPRTLRLRRTQLLLAASRLVASGREPSSITSLSVLVEPEAVKTILRSYLNGAGKPTEFTRGLAITLVSVATHWVRVDEAQLTALQAIKRRLGSTKVALTEKNRATLRQLDDPAVLGRLLELPERLAGEARRMESRPRAAVAMQLAVAITLLLHAPLRMANLHALRLDRHLSQPGGSKRPWLISIPVAESKNGERIDYELAGGAAVLLDRYLARFRPALVKGDCPFLFPGEDGVGGKDQGTLSQQLVEIIETRVGIRLTPHQFRHLAARLLLRAAPGAFGAAQQLLGHKHLKTTTAFYAGIDTLTAGRQYDRILESTRTQLPQRRPRRRS